MCLERMVLFCIGALGYGGLELAVRGHTHWTMLLAGGICLLGLRQISLVLSGAPFLARCAAGALLITGVELAVGLLCNRCLHWAVWDYSDQWGNLWGQICPQFSFYWFLLSMPLLWALDKMRPPAKPQNLTKQAGRGIL